jgi:hypothetical protein
VTGEWRKLHNVELNILYSSPSIVRVMTSRRRRLVGYVARMVWRLIQAFFWWGNLRERDQLGDPVVDKRIFFTAAIKNADAPILTCVWQELEYLIDLRRVTRGAHIERF